MKQYKVKRHEHVDYDEYVSLIVNAKNEEKARELAISFYHYFADEDVTIEEVQLDKEGVIHSHFNAG